MQADGLQRGFARVTHPVKSARLALIARPRKHAAAVELPVTRMKAPPHHAGGKPRNRQRTHSALHLPAQLLVRYDVDLSVAVGKVEQ